MKYLILILPLVAISTAQRPTYAGSSSKGYPELASRFRDPADGQVQNNTDASLAVGNRLGDGVDQPPQDLPTDARGDAFLVNRLNQWPREHRPFWLINAQHLEKHRHPDGTGNTQQVNQQGQTQNQQGAVTGNQQGLSGVGQVNGNQQVANGGQTGQLQSRFGEPVGSDTRTIRPLSQRGSFAGTRL